MARQNRIVVCGIAGLLALTPMRVHAQNSRTPARPHTPPSKTQKKNNRTRLSNLPVITEVLYAVPQGEVGDASGDGNRDATGDEFVEIYNPSPKTIRLTGWTLTDRNKPDAGQFLFVFPSFALRPGEVVVVFNGLNQTIPGPVGTPQQPPSAPNPHFHNAWVFTAGNTSSSVGFANSGDWVSLRTPASAVVSLVLWGKPSQTPPVSTPILETVPKTSRASVQRTIAKVGIAFEAHPTVDGLRFSPGLPPPNEDGLADARSKDDSVHADRTSDASDQPERIDRP